MLRDVISALDYSLCAEAALLIFCFAFAAMTYATMRLTSNATKQFAEIPLNDSGEEDQR